MTTDELADRAGLRLLGVLESLTYQERLAFVLRDMFGLPFEEIAAIVELSPAETEALVSRSRQRVHDAGWRKQVPDS